LLILFTAFVGFFCGTSGPIPFSLLLHTLTGTALAAGGAAAFNLIPFGPLDGAKVFRWNAGIYVLVMGAAIASLVGTWYLL